MNQTCFIIQPFDKRYHDVFAPAVEAAELAPYRVDLDPEVDVPGTCWRATRLNVSKK